MCVLIGSRNSDYPSTFALLGQELKRASRFMTVLKGEILAVNEAAAPTNTKKETKFGLSLITGLYKKIFSLNLQQHCIE